MSAPRAPHDASPTNPATAYALAVMRGEVITGHAVRRACERHLRDLEEGPARGLRFDRAAAARVLKFFSQALLAGRGAHARAGVGGAQPRHRRSDHPPDVR
jgi:hypothetical protein